MSNPKRTREAPSPSSCRALALSGFLVLALLPSRAHAAAGQEIKTGFDDMKVGAAPVGWQSGILGKVGSPHWHVATDASAPSAPNVLRQDGRAVYAWLVAPGFKASQGSVEARFKVESGKEDPEAGVIARFLDGNNYYYVRANVLENDLIFYRMANGKKDVVRRLETKVERNVWHKLRIEFDKDVFKVLLDDKEVMALTDAVLKGPGGVGIWTTADTVSEFDDFRASGTLARQLK